jgi:hypothetical protein
LPPGVLEKFIESVKKFKLDQIYQEARKRSKVCLPLKYPDFFINKNASKDPKSYVPKPWRVKKYVKFPAPPLPEGVDKRLRGVNTSKPVEYTSKDPLDFTNNPPGFYTPSWALQEVSDESVSHHYNEAVKTLNEVVYNKEFSDRDIENPEEMAVTVSDLIKYTPENGFEFTGDKDFDLFVQHQNYKTKVFDQIMASHKVELNPTHATYKGWSKKTTYKKIKNRINREISKQVTEK